jgi:aminoglycoside 2'-N-acetyltransferase I
MRTAHTADLDAATLGAIRALIDAAFAGEFGDDDWEHCLGGVHVLAYENANLVGHGVVVQRRLLHDGRALRCGYVEGVAVRPDRRRRGIASGVMAEVERLIRGGYDLGALSTTDDGIPLYESRGWRLWRGPTAALTPTGLTPTPDDDESVYVLPGEVPLDLDGEIACDWRDGDVW